MHEITEASQTLGKRRKKTGHVPEGGGKHDHRVASGR